ncbi:thioesterase-like superfamily-domain-containing protein [Lipomyces oligophaga]|uniref:thioesterase-like superfamily-domain-containing protein n=1 Tax=Lipomyces oligophaga TaxID=45792 RepID=UPI0034CEA42F
MADTITNSIEHTLRLEQLDADLFRSTEGLYKASDARGIYGGNVIAQSLMAAIRTVPSQFRVHSMHCYFVLAGDPSFPVLYYVENVRTGRSYCTRTVQARQKGRVIFTTTISFQSPAPSLLHHSRPYPGLACKQPEELESWTEWLRKRYAKGQASKVDLENSIEVDEISPIDIRPVLLVNPKGSGTAPADAKNMFWIRARGVITDLNAHFMALAYFSDWAMLGTSIRVNDVGNDAVAMMVSLDHAIYFHAPVKADDWLLYELESPWTGSARGLVYGRFWARDGTLVASIIQEGVVRLRKDRPTKL